MPEMVGYVPSPSWAIVLGGSDHTFANTAQQAKRPVYMLQHHPSQLSVHNADLKL